MVLPGARLRSWENKSSPGRNKKRIAAGECGLALGAPGLLEHVPELADSIDEKGSPGFEQKRERGASDAAQSRGGGAGCLIQFGRGQENRALASGWASRADRNPRRPAMLAHFSHDGDTSAVKQ